MAKHTPQSSLSSLTPTLPVEDETTGYDVPKILGPNGSAFSLDLDNQGTSFSVPVMYLLNDIRCQITRMRNLQAICECARL